MKKFLLLLPLLTLSITACSLFGKKDDNSGNNQSQSQEVIDTKIYGSGNQADEVLSVGFDIPAGEYWIKPSGVDDFNANFATYGARGYNPDSIYENQLFYQGCHTGELFLIKIKTGQFLRLNYAIAQNSKVDQGITTIKNGMFKVGEQIHPVDGFVRIKVCEKDEARIGIKPHFYVYTYDEDLGDYKYNALSSKEYGVFEPDDTQYHMIENPPEGSYILLIGLEVC